MRDLRLISLRFALSRPASGGRARRNTSARPRSRITGHARPCRRHGAAYRWRLGLSQRNRPHRRGFAAKLVFLNSTNLGVGPVSRVTLDQFVYVGEANGQKMAVNLAKGVFRFTTGKLDKNAYIISTPTAAIGVRGPCSTSACRARNRALRWSRDRRSSVRTGRESPSPSRSAIAPAPPAGRVDRAAIVSI